MPIMTGDRQKIDQLLQSIIFALFNLLIFTTPFIFTWFNQELFEFNKMLFVYIVSTVIVGLWLGRCLVRKQCLWQKRTHNYVLLFFLASQLLATLFSIHQRTSIFGYYTRFNGGLLSVFTYASLFFAAQYNLHKKQLLTLLKNLLFAALLISIYAIPEHFGHSMSCLIVTSKFNVACWVQDVQNRVFATFGQPNWLASFLLMTIPLAIWQLWQKMRSHQQNIGKIMVYALLIVLLSTTLLFTKSRSGILALAIALIFQLSAQYFLVKKPPGKRLNLFALLLPAVLILLVVATLGQNLSLSQANQSLLTSLTEGLESNGENIEESIDTIEQTGGSKSSDIRKVVWQGAWQVWQRYPIFGSGVETFAYSYYQDRPAAHNLLSEWDFLYNKAHNELLNFLATTGLVGLLTYLALFLGLFFYLIKQWRKQQLTSLQIALTSALLAMFISNFFGFSTVTTNLLFSFYAAIIVKEEISWPKIEKSTLTWFEYLIMSILLFMLISLNKKIWQIWRADYLFYNAKNHLEEGKWQTGLTFIQDAIEQSPKEALFYDELASQYSILAIAFAEEGQATNSAKFAEAAITTSNYVQKLNPVHLNFLKSRARIFIRLGELDAGFYESAKDTLTRAIKLSPTEAKLYYNLALVEEEMGNQKQAIELLKQSIDLKADYWQAYYALGQIYTLQNNSEAAMAQYQYILDKIDPNNEMAQKALQELIE